MLLSPPHVVPEHWLNPAAMVTATPPLHIGAEMSGIFGRIRADDKESDGRYLKQREAGHTRSALRGVDVRPIV
jgi:hypothetical protein